MTLWGMTSPSTLTGSFHGIPVVNITPGRSALVFLMNRLITSTGDILPAFEGTLVYFTSHLARTVRHNTIKIYLAAVRSLWVSSSYDRCPLKGAAAALKDPSGHSSLPGLPSHPSPPGYPPPPPVLLAIRLVLQSWLGAWDFSMIWAAFTLAFFAFLRCSELPTEVYITLTLISTLRQIA